MRTVLGLTLCMMLGCTFEDGSAFGTMQPAAIDARFDPGSARELGEGTFLTNEGYHITLEIFALELSSLEFQELRGGGGSGETFDPADPPEGYTLCHNGHCHSEEGGLVDYETIQRELSGSAAIFEPIVILRLNGETDLLTGMVTSASVYEPSADLGMHTISRCELQAQRIRVSGSVSEGALSEPVPLSIDLTVEEPLVVVVNRAIDRDHPEQIEVSVQYRVGASFFDSVAFADAVEAGAILVTSSTHELANAFLTALAEQSLTITFDEL